MTVMFAAALALLLTAATVTAGTEELDPRVAAATVRIERTDRGRCTGVLVAPDVVATAAHCARGDPPAAMRFYVGGEKRTGLDFIARGMTITDLDVGTTARGKDWLLVRIEPVAALPLPLATAAEIDAARKAQADVVIASYQGKSLHTLGDCDLIALELVGFFAMTCKVRDGDSGGPIVLSTPGGPRLIGLVYAQGKKASMGTSATQFAHLLH